ncbi:DUF1998 domain-containing protein [Gammaproteobacteria bacterium]|nr:DUF1998 domain-containing protein [Gammaproteobacteria bacterium]|tara:strand:- start:6940 stop:8799 length:1860 start_codon:yes stop_codon:yes gene_type:complete
MTDFSALKMRKSQMIAGFGVGAIVEIDNQSLIAKDISTWSSVITRDKKFRVDSIPRLEKLLGIRYIISPPSAPSKSWENSSSKLSIPYHRFPKWLECRKCNSLRKYTIGVMYVQNFRDVSCHGCHADSSNLTPVRFIFAPEDGSLDDISWSYILHAGTGSGCTSEKLVKRSIQGKGGGLSALEVSCDECSIKKNMSQIKGDLYMQTSRGVMPWQQGAARSNNANPNSKHNSFQQRGATSLYQPQIVSALDLIGSNYEQEQNLNKVDEYLDGNHLISRYKGKLEVFEENDMLTDELKSEQCLRCQKDLMADAPEDVTEISIEDIKKYLFEEKIEEELPDVNLAEINDESLKVGEFKLLNEDGHNIFKNYDGEKYALSDPAINPYLESVTRIKKLREVRVLKGYTRHFYPKFHSVNASEKRLPFLPGYEVFGEGLFLQFNMSAIKTWEKLNRDEIKSRIIDMQMRQEKDATSLPFPTPRFVLVHTFSHLLIKQLCFESGYSAASIKERLYVNEAENMCGVLIYTADADSEGSLGGLVRMSDEKRLSHSIKSMLESASWCSSDPTCIEIGSPGTRGLNKAACHACSLISETSCAYMNALLDRGILIGSKKEGLKGFFDGINT